MTKKIIVYLFLVSLTIAAHTQTKIDSLNSVLAKINIETNPTQAIEVINQIYDLTKETQPMIAIEKSAMALNICDSILKDKSKVAEWKLKLAKIYINTGKYDFALKNVIEARNYYSETGDSIGLAKSFYYTGKVYSALNLNEIAVSSYEKSLDIFKKNNDTTNIVQVDIDLAELYYENSYDEEYAQKYKTALNEALKLAGSNKELLCKIYQKFALIKANNSETDSAIAYEKTALANAVSDFQRLNIFTALGDIWQEDNLDSAVHYYKIALSLAEKMNFPQKKCEIFNKLGQTYFYYEKYTEAEKYFKDALNLALALDISSQKLIAYDYLAQIYTFRKDYKTANQYLIEYNKELAYSFQTSDKQSYAGIIINFQNEENKKEIELLQKEDALKSQLLKNKQQQVYGALILIALMLGLAILSFYFFRRQKKINKLLQEQNHQINLQKKEIETQSKILEKATRDLLKQKDKILNQNNKIQASINYASRIQKAMLPSADKLREFFEDAFVLFMPKEVVSGDFYWFSTIKERKPSLFKTEEPDDKIIVAVADCTGHGVPGAFMSLLGDAFLNQIINIQKIIQPDKILNELHKLIRQTLQQSESENNDGMDIAICLIDKKEKTLKFAGAKNPLVYIQNNKMTRVLGDLTSIGGLQKEKERIFTLHTIDITAPTWIYMYSDGFQDQFGGQYGRKFMARPFRELLFKYHKLPFAEQKEKIYMEFKKWKGKKYPQMDDITIMGIKI